MDLKCASGVKRCSLSDVWVLERKPGVGSRDLLRLNSDTKWPLGAQRGFTSKGGRSSMTEKEEKLKQKMLNLLPPEPGKPGSSRN